jgi:hypothetical protein
MALKVLQLNDWRVKQALRHEALVGKKCIARGAFSAVYEGGRANTVIKVTTDSFNYWMLNCNVSAVDHRHFPRLVENYQDIGEISLNGQMFPIYAFEIERLQKLEIGSDTRKLASAIAQQHRSSKGKLTTARYRCRSKPMSAAEQIEDIVKCAKNLPRSVKNALRQLENFCATCDDGGIQLDMHLGNFMQRKNGELVITDPLMDFNAYQARISQFRVRSW